MVQLDRSCLLQTRKVRFFPHLQTSADWCQMSADSCRPMATCGDHWPSQAESVALSGHQSDPTHLHLDDLGSLHNLAHDVHALVSGL